MNRSPTLLPYVPLAVLSLFGAAPGALEGLEDALRARGRALEELVDSEGDAPLARFLDEQVAPSFGGGRPRAELLEDLRRLRASCAPVGGVEWAPLGEDGLAITFENPSGRRLVRLRVEREPPHRVRSLELGERAARASVAPITWGDLEARLAEEEAAGFSGAVLVARDGAIVLQRGYGLADPESGARNGPETVFAIGSTPIDFTRAAVLALEERGLLRSADPLTKFLEDVPEDKRGITLDQLMSGASGLPDFHDLPGVDADPDLSWIDRATALRRILGAELLFAPGEGQAHSHSAWVLLAAIVEIVSGEPYGELLRERFFVPAGMERTGLYPLARSFAPGEVALGLAGTPRGERNSPAHWGETSWLVMGSGGMVSTVGDLYRWKVAMREGKLLGPAALARYGSAAFGVGGNDRGFLCVTAEHGGDVAILCSNAHASMFDAARALGERLAELVGAR